MDHQSKIAVIGYGVEGKAMLEYLLKHGYDDVTVCDQNVRLKDKMPEGVSVRLGEHYLNGLDDFDVIFRSPGVSYLNPAIVEARLLGAEVTSPTQFFLNECPCCVVGVTGTKGKGTTSTLIYEILKAWFEKKAAKGSKKGKTRHAYLGGNIGNAPIEFLDKLKGDDVVVLELSCFQLGDLNKSPHVAVLLNTTSDHLDYYPDRGAYMRAKELILAHQDADDLAVLNFDYEYAKYYEPQVRGRLAWVSPAGVDLSGMASSGAGDERLDEDGAVYIDEGVIMYSRGGKSAMVMPVREVALIGSHNLENVCPAVAVAKEFGVADEVIEKVVKKFRGLPHRLELVRELHGVRYYNDSFSTNPQTSMAAVDSFDVPTVLIAGGSDKGLSYNEWARKILTKRSLVAVFLIGETSEKMWDAIETAEKKLKPGEGTPTMVVMCENLKEALGKAKEYAEGVLNKEKEGAASRAGVVVMSPAAASFDQFKDYKDRGKKFGELAMEL